MGEMGGGKPLKDPPTTLKEAIDWLVLVGGDKAWEGTGEPEKLEEALKKLPGFDNTASSNRHFTRDKLSHIIYIYSQALDSAFLGYNGQNGIVLSGESYKSAYSGASWIDDNASEYAKIFLFLACLVFYFITFVYWMCKGNGRWANQMINNSGPRKKFLEAMGFPSNLLNLNKQSSLIENLLKDMPNAGFPELQASYGSGEVSSYDAFLTKLEANGSRDALPCPLTKCKIVSYAYLKSKANGGDVANAVNKIKTELVRLSTSPTSTSTFATDYFSKLTEHIRDLLGKIQSFDTNSVSSPSGSVSGTTLSLAALGGGAAAGTGAAYVFNVGAPLSSCPSNLKGAIDWILRVTGKDGGSNQNGTSQLAEEVKRLLESVKGSGSGLVADIEKVIGALIPGNTGLIAKLAEGLRQFIGYENGSAKIQPDVGIAVSNLPVERLRDAVLMFIAPFLGVLRYNHPDLKVQYATQLGEAVEACKKGVGCGEQGFEGALGTVETALGSVYSSLSGDIKNVLEKVKDVTQLKSKSAVQQLANGFMTYFNNVLEKVADDKEVKGASVNTQVSTLKDHLITLLTNVGQQTDTLPINVGDKTLGLQTNGLKTHIEKVNGSNGALKGLYTAFNSGNLRRSNTKAYALSAAAYNGVNLFVTVLQTDYTSYYKGAMWNQVSGEATKCAKMLLSCLPLIFNGLSYFYWKCSSNGGWTDMTLGSPEPKAFMGLTSIGANRVKSGRKGSDVESVMKTSFSEFSTAATSGQSYADFLKRFKGNCLTTWQGSSDANDNFLSGIYLCSTSYFRHQHQNKAANARPPSSIREMLYWLMGLTATPQFGDLLGHIHDVVGKGFKVAVSGSSNKNETLSADKVTSYILSTCYTCPSVLNVIQGRVPPEESQNEPWLHDLYSNAAFPFKYPTSGVALLYALSDYTYALQFQLSFLYKQCQDMYINTCGWQFCTFGKSINTTLATQIVTSHICVTGCSNTSQHTGGDHASGPCKHDKCGQAGNNASPLQAFLTDKLKGFSRGHPSDPSSHLATCSGSLCHVPMGFKSDQLRGDPKNGAQGGNISLTLKPFCGNPNTPLRQLCGTLTCLSKRAPRSLGDLFGFYWQVTGQLFYNIKNQDNDPSSSLNGAISTLLSKLKTVESGLLYVTLTANVKAIGNHFFGLSWHCHRKQDWKTVKRSSGGSYCDDHENSNKARDLMSLYDSECPNSTCGKYLQPLTMSDGATFADKYAFTYLSWAAHLTDELSESFQEFLEKLNIHTCKNCKHSCSHSSTSQCSCPSVVDCAVVLPHLYAYGFSFKDAFSLKGMQYESGRSKYTQTSKTKRQCSDIATQLQSVITGNPLSNLLTSIDAFLYAIRWEFFSKLSAFWSVYICLILYTFFFLLDTLHLRSHLKLSSSHTVPPLALLTSGNPLPVTKLKYIGH
ncbi:variant erythrocyte surface antigen-1 family protein [Babesia caballi]|uniref:Variant erythrocyte surface antigen-1 family protein n=1 Tax=Babesia caballi TaxID=5871 RepID=A0AAV4LS35_BABCB|nr:variant erythrocyte surface antigen-1 family protein [Babesia caballi]